jgi:transcriptional regulator with XRE-family HTH domain
MASTDTSASEAENQKRAFRAEEFRARLIARGLTLAELGRRIGISRNVLYRLSKGRAPKAAVHERIEALLAENRTHK